MMPDPGVRPLPPSGMLYHYTSRSRAQEISLAGAIQPGVRGHVYLTDMLFRFGWQAADYLAIPSNPEVAIPVPVDDDLLRWLSYAGPVPESTASTGLSVRRGGGHQWVVPGPIPVQVKPWSWVQLEVP